MFITFEGSEGSGTTSQCAALKEFLSRQGYDVLTTREPGGTPIGEQIRHTLLNLDNVDMHPRAEILLFQASRAQLVDQVIRPHLEGGGIVLSDRYADSTLAYQGYGYRFDLDILQTLIDFATGGLKPELTLFLDVDVQEGLRRRSQGGDVNRLDSYELDFYQRVRSGYQQMARAEPERWQTVDAGLPFDRVQERVRQLVMQRLKTRERGG